MRLFPRMCPGLLVPYTSFSLPVPFPRAFLSYTLLSLYFFFPCFFPCRLPLPVLLVPYAKTKNAPCRFLSRPGHFLCGFKKECHPPAGVPVLPGAANIAAVVRTVKMDFFDGLIRFLQRFV